MPEVELATDEGRRRFTWEAGTITVGRLPSNDLVVPSKHISRTHAELAYADGWVWITDLSSAYGVWVGERRVLRHALAVGQTARLAPHVFLTLIADAPDLAAQPTTHLPAAPNLPLDEMPTRLRIPTAPIEPGTMSGPPGRWLRATEPMVWGSRSEPEPPPPDHVSRRPTPEYAGFEDEREGDVFRRQATDPNASAPAVELRAGRPVARLVVCATCGERNPLGAVSCHACGHGLAVACAACGLSLLAAQERCPRCHTPNTGFSDRIS